MEKSILKRLLSHLGRHAFESFVVELFGSTRNAEPFKELTAAGEGVYYQPILDSYGGSLHSVFALHYSPFVRGGGRSLPSSAVPHREMIPCERGYKAYNGPHAASVTSPMKAPAFECRAKDAPQFTLSLSKHA
jgi:hypothetical protein